MMKSDLKHSPTTPVCLTLLSLFVLLVNDFYGFSKYIRPITKTAASLGFLYVGLTCGLVQCDQGNYVFLGLVLSAVGDVFLLSLKPHYFQAGAIFFLLAHLMYCGAFAMTGISLKWFLLSGIIIGPAAAVVYRYILPHTTGLMRKLVITYSIAISWMMAFASGSYGYSGKGWLLTAALLFYVSDLFVARQRFIKRCFLNSLCGLTLYYTAQLMFATCCSH